MPGRSNPDKNLTKIRAELSIKGMEELTLGAMVLRRMSDLALDYEGAAALTGISERHLKRITADEGFQPNSSTKAKLLRLGLSEAAIETGAYRSKVLSLQAKLLQPAGA